MQLQKFRLASSNMPAMNFSVHLVHKLHRYVPLLITILSHIVTINGTEMTIRLVENRSRHVLRTLIVDMNRDFAGLAQLAN